MFLSKKLVAILGLAVGLAFGLFAGRAEAQSFVTAAIHWTGGKAQFFLSDGTYIRYDIAADHADAGYPRPIDNRTWPGMGDYATAIVAACNGPAGKAYFFLGDGTYLRYDIAADHVDAGYPKPIDDRTWPGLGRYATKIAGALNWTDGKIQFFTDDGYYLRYDVAADHVDAGYPKPIDRGTWPGLAPYARDLSGMINWENGKVYFFLDTSEYVRYDVAADQVDPGYPKRVDDKTWPGLGARFGKHRAQ